MTAVLESGLPPGPSMVITPNPALYPAGNGLVEETKNYAEGIQHIQLTLTSVKVAVADSDAFGGTRLAYLPNRNYIFLGGKMNLTWTKDGTGIVTSENPKAALGTAIATNATLSSTMINLINGGSGGTSLGTGLTGTLQLQSNDNVTAIPYVGVADSATSGLFLNVGVNPTGDGSVTFSGTIDLWYVDLGAAP